MAGWKFWERSDNELALPGASATNTGLDFSQHYEPPTADSGSFPGLPPLQSQNSFAPQSSPNPFQPSSFAQLQQSMPAEDHNTGSSHSAKDLEIITAKLDAIRAQLETMNVRLGVLEQRIPVQPPTEGASPRRPWY